jgi:DNA primase large subunit
MIGDERTRRRYALAEAKRSSDLLRLETPEKLLQIATSSFNWNARLGGEEIEGATYPLSVHFTNYLANATKIRDINWKLTNRIVRGGYVSLQTDEFARLLEEEVQRRVLEKSSQSITLPAELERTLASFRERLWERSRQMGYEELPKAVVAAAMPPCIRYLLSALQSGKHIPHMGRFGMAAFLINVGIGEEEVIKMLRALTDFDERVTRYQVEHIAGKRGSRRKYTAPNCKTMQTHGLCINPDDICGTITHPLRYYRRRMRMMFAGRRRSSVVERRRS